MKKLLIIILSAILIANLTGCASFTASSPNQNVQTLPAPAQGSPAPQGITVNDIDF